MSAHSLGAYRIVVKMRSAKTLLVEGVSDKTVMHRLLLNHEGSSQPVIDTPDLLRDERLTGLGNRTKVQLAATEIGDCSKFLALTDREWDEFDDATYSHHHLQHPPQIGCPRTVTTLGHSMENYFADEETFVSYLCRVHAGDITRGVVRLVREQFVDSARLGLAFSLAARDLHLLSSLDGLPKRDDISVDSTGFALKESFAQALMSRRVEAEIAQRFVVLVADYRARINSVSLDASVAKWALHGHAGCQMAWSCIALLLQEAGVSDDVCEQVERGRAKEKLLHGADRLAANEDEGRPLHWIARWLDESPGGGDGLPVTNTP